MGLHRIKIRIAAFLGFPIEWAPKHGCFAFSPCEHRPKKFDWERDDCRIARRR